MGRAGALGLYTALLCMGSVVSVEAGPRAGFFAPGNAPHAPEVMLYFSHAVGAGAGGSLRPTFGLRVQQVHLAGNSGDPESGNPMQHRELINWQMEARPDFRLADLRVKLGNRVTYDVASRRFASSSRPAMPIGIPSLRNAPLHLTPVQRQPLPRESSLLAVVGAQRLQTLTALR